MEQRLLREVSTDNQNLKYFPILSMIYIAGMMTSLTVSARLLPLHIPMTNFTILLTAGTWTIPLSFFIQDITTEVYGYAQSRYLVQITMIILVAYIAYLKLTTLFPEPHNIVSIDRSYNTVFNTLPRHLLALLAAIFTGNLVNDYILSTLKKKLKGRYLPFRFIGATIIGELVLQLAGTTVAWFGHLHFTTEILPFILFSYVYKIVFEAILTPVNVVVCGWLKQAEGIDAYDDDVDYNPFSTRRKRNPKGGKK
ncbi:MAG: hypothetical protein COV52_01720 [Gammaproteobacteria bacterium CG11_big_fil_rev_8_21_14_0_20_46_22]|nr:MAG: hypothetical protein COW05_05615 [Gammaproteobacteria bacterium CG12_big_fil_rev_8_21_14_0_65_46_12]PIR11832.1 MAG: hypothetical protein COV52_01720 [Gammaproteobacteria bacterium CG11_big_fil_rev_8_21_14_0_20_46_22]